MKEPTPQRLARMQRVLERRQPSLTVVLENVHDPHNISAVLRSCDAVGVPNVFILNNKDMKPTRLGKKSSASARKWLEVEEYHDTETCFAEVRKRYGTICASHISPDATPLYDMDLTQPMALVFGNEKDGVSDAGLELSDQRFVIPQMGMIRSLNISVACAVTLYEVFRQRHRAGMYHESQLDQDTLEEMLGDWKYR